MVEIEALRTGRLHEDAIIAVFCANLDSSEFFTAKQAMTAEVLCREDTEVDDSSEDPEFCCALKACGGVWASEYFHVFSIDEGAHGRPPQLMTLTDGVLEVGDLELERVGNRYLQEQEH